MNWISPHCRLECQLGSSGARRIRVEGHRQEQTAAERFSWKIAITNVCANSRIFHRKSYYHFIQEFLLNFFVSEAHICIEKRGRNANGGPVCLVPIQNSNFVVHRMMVAHVAAPILVPQPMSPNSMRLLRILQILNHRRTNQYHLMLIRSLQQQVLTIVTSLNRAAALSKVRLKKIVLHCVLASVCAIFSSSIVTWLRKRKNWSICLQKFQSLPFWRILSNTSR